MQQADLVAQLQDLVRTYAAAFYALPAWAALCILFAPTVLALFTRRLAVIASAFLLNAASLLVLAVWPDRSGAVTLATMTSVAAIVLVLYGLGERRRGRQLSELDARIENLHEQMMVFLDALDHRSRLVDGRAEEAARELASLKRAAAQRGAPASPVGPG
jgi:hypothetical protein